MEEIKLFVLIEIELIGVDYFLNNWVFFYLLDFRFDGLKAGLFKQNTGLKNKVE